jgi:hypothetical protein
MTHGAAAAYAASAMIAILAVALVLHRRRRNPRGF